MEPNLYFYCLNYAYVLLCCIKYFPVTMASVLLIKVYIILFYLESLCTSRRILSYPSCINDPFFNLGSLRTYSYNRLCVFLAQRAKYEFTLGK
jgi:hypothetical protein